MKLNRTVIEQLLDLLLQFYTVMAQDLNDLVLRDRGLTRFTALGFPTTALEDWKYTSVAPLAEQTFRLPEAEVQALADTVMADYRQRHRDLPQTFADHFAVVYLRKAQVAGL